MKSFTLVGMLLATGPAVAQDRATLGTREILAASTQPDPPIARHLNERPRKTSMYQTPAEMLAERVATIC